MNNRIYSLVKKLKKIWVIHFMGTGWLKCRKGRSRSVLAKIKGTYKTFIRICKLVS